MKRIINITGIMSVAMLAFFTLAVPTTEAAACNFTRTLSEGSDGEDIRCLQKFLNLEGFTIASTGPGSRGSETDEFRTKTKEAVTRWQKANGLIDDGIFGPGSQKKYSSLVSGGTSIPSTTTPSSDELSELKVELAQANATISILKRTSSSSLKQETQELALDLEKLRSNIDDAEDEGVDVDQAENDYLIAVKNFVIAISSAINGKGSDEEKYSSKGNESVIDALNILRENEESEGDLEDILDSLDDELDDLEDEIDDADDDGDDVDEAEDLYDDARDLLEEAEEEFDKEDYEDTRDIVQDLDEVIEEIYDELNLDRSGDKEKAKDAIDDAEDAIDDAEDAIDDADDDGDDVDDAQDLLDDAQDLLDDAEDEYDDEDYEKARELAEEAEDLADDAEDEL